jgi:hypothetical protein
MPRLGTLRQHTCCESATRRKLNAEKGERKNRRFGLDNSGPIPMSIPTRSSLHQA